MTFQTLTDKLGLGLLVPMKGNLNAEQNSLCFLFRHDNIPVHKART